MFLDTLMKYVFLNCIVNIFKSFSYKIKQFILIKFFKKIYYKKNKLKMQKKQVSFDSNT